MRYPTLFLWAFACILVIHGRSLSPRQAIQATQQTFASSFTEVKETYSSMSTSFVETRQSIQSATTFDQCSTVITQLTTQISQAVSAIAGGCNCDANGVDTNSLQTMISTWFIELQAIAQIVQNRFPQRYSYFSSSFTQISSHIEVALGVGYSSGLRMDNIVQGAIQRSNINPSVFSNFKIDTSRFTHISQSVNNRVGVFSNGPPGGSRFPHRIPGGFHPGKPINPAHRGPTIGTPNPAHSGPTIGTPNPAHTGPTVGTPNPAHGVPTIGDARTINPAHGAPTVGDGRPINPAHGSPNVGDAHTGRPYSPPHPWDASGSPGTGGFRGPGVPNKTPGTSQPFNPNPAHTLPSTNTGVNTPYSTNPVPSTPYNQRPDFSNLGGNRGGGSYPHIPNDQTTGQRMGTGSPFNQGTASPFSQGTGSPFNQNTHNQNPAHTIGSGFTNPSTSPYSHNESPFSHGPGHGTGKP